MVNIWTVTTTPRLIRLLQQKTTEKERKLFTGRADYIRQIEDAISKQKTLAVVAPAGFGKTSLLRHIAAKTGSFYIDLRNLSLSPENFGVELMGTSCFLYFAKKESEQPDYGSLEGLKQLKIGEKCKSLIGTVENELEKIKPDQELIIRSALGFIDELAASQKRKLCVLLNNFDEMLKLNNFSQVRDILQLFFQEIGKFQNTCFVLGSSAPNLMRSSLKKYSVGMIELLPLSVDETRVLFEKIAGKADDRIIEELHSLSGGIPTIVRAISSRYSEEKRASTQENIQLVRYIMLSDLTTTTSQSYFYCSKLFSDSLGRARGEALLKTILKAVSQNRPLRLTEIARLIYRSGPVTKSLLERLVEVDMISKEGNTFDFSNPVLKAWCRMMFSNIEHSETPDEKTLKERGLL